MLDSRAKEKQASGSAINRPKRHLVQLVVIVDTRGLTRKKIK